MQIRFLSPVRTGRVVAEASVLRQGTRIVHLECRVHDANDQLVAVATGSFAVLKSATQDPNAAGT